MSGFYFSLLFCLLFILQLFITGFIYVAGYAVIAIFRYWSLLSWIKIQNYLQDRNFRESFFLTFRVDLISWIGHRWIFHGDLFFANLSFINVWYILIFFVVCSSSSSIWVTELLPKFFDIWNSIIST